MESAPTWSEMPQDIPRIIGSMIEGFEDYVRFGAVCKSWKLATFSSYNDCPKNSKRRLECPWLMLVENKTGKGEEPVSSGKRGFYSLSSGKEYHVDLSESYGRKCFGSSCGWLVTLDTDQKMHLLNPITRKQLPLPSETTLPHQDYPSHRRGYTKFMRRFFVDKASVFWAGGTLVVFVIYSDKYKVAMARPGDEAWTPVECSYFGFLNIELFRGQVLALRRTQIFVCDLSLSPPRLIEFDAPPIPVDTSAHVYLADMGGDLYVLHGYEDDSPCSHGACVVKYGFDAFKLDKVNKKWEDVGNLGGWTAFVGRNSTFALRSSDYPCRPDSVYFTDDIDHPCKNCGGSDYGIFSFMPRRHLSRRPFRISSQQQLSLYAPPLWLAPSMW